MSLATRPHDPPSAPEARVDKDAAKRSFLRMVSHELRTPLNAIIGFSDILAQELYGPLGSPQYVEYAGIIRDSGAKLLGLFNNFLEIVRLESAGELPCVHEPVLGPLEEARSRVKSIAQARGVTIDIRLIDEDLCARYEPRALASSLDHLLINAIDFTPPGETIELDAWAHDGQVELSVFNYGLAPEPADIERLMLPFEQGSTAIARTREGAGLGWAIVRLSCAAMGGDFRVISRPGESLRAIMSLRG